MASQKTELNVNPLTIFGAEFNLGTRPYRLCAKVTMSIDCGEQIILTKVGIA